MLTLFELFGAVFLVIWCGNASIKSICVAYTLLQQCQHRIYLQDCDTVFFQIMSDKFCGLKIFKKNSSLLLACSCWQVSGILGFSLPFDKLEVQA